LSFPFLKGENMIFYSVHKDIVVNSKKTNKVICRFKDGKFETDDPILIEKLKERFRYKENLIADFNRLRKEAIKKGIKVHRKTKKADLIKALEGVI